MTGESLPYALLRPFGLADTDTFPWEQVAVARSWVHIALAAQLIAFASLAVWVWRRPTEVWRAAALAPIVGLALNRVFSAQFNLVVFVAIGLLAATSRITTRQRRQLLVLLGGLAVTNFAVFPGNVRFWFACKVVYWVGLLAVVVILLRSTSQPVPDPQE